MFNLGLIQEINTHPKSIYCCIFHACLNTNHRLKKKNKQPKTKHQKAKLQTEEHCQAGICVSLLFLPYLLLKIKYYVYILFFFHVPAPSAQLDSQITSSCLTARTKSKVQSGAAMKLY